MDRIREDELARGMLEPVTVLVYLKGDDTEEHVLLPGGKHPKMAFVGDGEYIKSFSACIAFDTSDPTIKLLKGPSRLEVAVTAAGLGAAGAVERFTPTALTAGIIEERNIFNVDDDVVVQISAAGGAGTYNLVKLHFDRVE